jgi:hypothetical protein
MERQIILHRPWTCQWARFGHVVVPGRETTCGAFWSCVHPDLPEGPKLLGSNTCTGCRRWTACSRLAAEECNRLDMETGAPSAGERHGDRS